MIYLVFVAAAICAALAIYSYCCYEGVFSPVYKHFPRKKSADGEVVPFSKDASLWLMIGMFPILLLVQVLLHRNTQIVALVKLVVLLAIVICAGIVDLKKRIIPNLLVCFGLLFWVGITVLDVVNSDNLKGLLASELIGFLVGFVLLAVVSVLTKGALGFGDVKLFGVIGLIGGAFCTYSTLLVSLIVSVIVAVIGMATKKIGRKDSIPFGPCIMLGYIIVLFLGSY